MHIYFVYATATAGRFLRNSSVINFSGIAQISSEIVDMDGLNMLEAKVKDMVCQKYEGHEKTKIVIRGLSYLGRKEEKLGVSRGSKI